MIKDAVANNKNIAIYRPETIKLIGTSFYKQQMGGFGKKVFEVHQTHKPSEKRCREGALIQLIK